MADSALFNSVDLSTRVASSYGGRRDVPYCMELYTKANDMSLF